MTGAADPRTVRGREFDRFIGRLLIAVTPVAVALLTVGVAIGILVVIGLGVVTALGAG